MNTIEYNSADVKMYMLHACKLSTLCFLMNYSKAASVFNPTSQSGDCVKNVMWGGAVFKRFAATNNSVLSQRKSKKLNFLFSAIRSVLFTAVWRQMWRKNSTRRRKVRLESWICCQLFQVRFVRVVSHDMRNFCKPVFFFCQHWFSLSLHPRDILH